MWKQSIASANRFRTVLDSIPLIASDEIRESLYERVLDSVSQLPAPLAEQLGNAKGARFVRIELPGKQRVITLAEVQMSEGQNVALKKKASQSSTDFGGAAARAVDGNTDGSYSSNTQTHTRPKTTRFGRLTWDRNSR